jgi:beta-barrel assembly-enhancing protease
MPRQFVNLRTAAAAQTAGRAAASVVAVAAAVAASALAPSSLAQASRPADSVATPSVSGLPSMGGAGEMSLIQERKIGDSIAKQLWRDPDLLDDPLLQAYVDGVYAAIVAAARDRGELDADMADKFAWKAFVGKDRSVNAFALPGGYFGVHAGMLKATQTRDEFASVVAHEVSHVTQRHISRSMAKDAQNAPLVMAGTILGLVLASRSGSADALAATAYGSQAVGAQMQLNYSRDMEREADRVGLNVLTHAGYNADGMRSMFERLQQATRLVDSGQYPYLRSHPLNTERIAEVQARLQVQGAPSAGGPLNPAGAASPSNAASSGTGLRLGGLSLGNPSRNAGPGVGQGFANDPALSQRMHALMSARAKVLADNTLDQLRALAAEAQHIKPESLKTANGIAEAPFANLFAAGLALHRLREFEAAQTVFSTLNPILVPDSVEFVAIKIAANELLRDQAIAQGPKGNWAAVLASAEGLDRAAHLGRPALMAWAATQISADQPARATDKLQNWVADHSQDPYAWRMLSKSYAAQGRQLRSVEALAQAHKVEGDLKGALERLQAAQRMARNTAADHVDASIIDTKAREIQSALREQAVQDRFNRQLAHRVHQ